MDYNRIDDYLEGYEKGLEDGSKITKEYYTKNDIAYKKCKKEFRRWLCNMVMIFTSINLLLYLLFGTNGIIERLQVISATPYKTGTILDKLLIAIVIFNFGFVIIVTYLTDKRGI